MSQSSEDAIERTRARSRSQDKMTKIRKRQTSRSSSGHRRSYSGDRRNKETSHRKKRRSDSRSRSRYNTNGGSRIDSRNDRSGSRDLVSGSRSKMSNSKRDRSNSRNKTQSKSGDFRKINNRLLDLAQYDDMAHEDKPEPSLSPTPQKHKKTKKEKKSKKKKKRKDSSSDSEDSEDYPSPKKKKSKKKKKKSKAVDELAASVAELEAKAMARNKEVDEARKKRAPMTKEDWDKQQSVVRREYDEDTGRVRLVKGSGEILEEIVSRDRARDINRAATAADGTSFQRDVKSRLGVRARLH